MFPLQKWNTIWSLFFFFLFFSLLGVQWGPWAKKKAKLTPYIWKTTQRWWYNEPHSKIQYIYCFHVCSKIQKHSWTEEKKEWQRREEGGEPPLISAWVEWINGYGWVGDSLSADKMVWIRPIFLINGWFDKSFTYTV